MKNLFVICLDDFHHHLLSTTPQAKEVEFHHLLFKDQIRGREGILIAEATEEATRQLKTYQGSVDGIIGYWDFPVNMMVSILRERFELPTASVDHVMRCEHKLWSRVEMQKIAPDVTPPFAGVDPFADDVAETIELDYPFWLKPVIGYGSALGFMIRGPEHLNHALAETRKRIGRFGKPTEWVLEQCDCPAEAGGKNGHLCVAEGIIGGRQCTLEGFVHQGKAEVYGVIDSLRCEGLSSFASYQYPPLLSEPVQDRMIEASTRVLEHMGLEERAFNIEYFWDEETDHIWLLEINTRPSQSHSDLFAKVDGVTNQSVLIDLALGRRPKMPHRQGKFKTAGKFFLRRFQDGRVTRAPSQEEVQEIENTHPGTKIRLRVEEGDVLSEQPDRDSYSFELAWVYAGADDHDQLAQVYEDCASRLRFECEDV